LAARSAFLGRLASKPSNHAPASSKHSRPRRSARYDDEPCGFGRFSYVCVPPTVTQQNKVKRRLLATDKRVGAFFGLIGIEKAKGHSRNSLISPAVSGG